MYNRTISAIQNTIGVLQIQSPSIAHLSNFRRMQNPPSFAFGPTGAAPGAYSLVRIYPGTQDVWDIAFNLENVVPVWLKLVFEMIIPFYRFSSLVLFGEFQSDLSQSLIIGVRGPNRLSMRIWANEGSLGWSIDEWMLTNVWVDAMTKVWGRTDKDFDIKVVVGHGVYGLLAKGLAAQNGYSGVSFDSSRFLGSPASVFQSWEMPLVEKASNKITDYQSGAKWLASEEDDSLARNKGRLPSQGNVREFFRLPSVPETFCQVAAGCTATNRYDSLCEALVGRKRFYEFFEEWNRTRSST
jgi:hypothetical protein